MARIRTIKPDFFLDEGLAEVSMAARLTFAGLWCQADREGRVEDRPKKLKVTILPFDDVDMDAILTTLAASGHIDRYTADGKNVIQIRAFAKHQKPHPREPKSELPGKPTASRENTRPAAEKKTEGDGLPVGMDLDLDLDRGMGSGSGREPSAPPRAHEDRVEEPRRIEPPFVAPMGSVLTPEGLKQAIRVVVEREHPELCFWRPGRFAVRDLLDFLPRPDSPDAAEEAEKTIRRRIVAFSRLDDPWVVGEGWSVKAFVDRWATLDGGTGPPKTSRERTAARVVDEFVNGAKT